MDEGRREEKDDVADDVSPCSGVSETAMNIGDMPGHHSDDGRTAVRMCCGLWRGADRESHARELFFQVPGTVDDRQQHNR